jgi:hypothetical protein
MTPSPAIDAAVTPLRKAERPPREKAEAEPCAEKAELAGLAEATWTEAAKAAIGDGKPTPERPPPCNAGTAAPVPRHAANDGTIERLGATLARRPRATLPMRDELAARLEGMACHSGGGADRPFWLQAPAAEVSRWRGWAANR